MWKARSHTQGAAWQPGLPVCWSAAMSWTRPLLHPETSAESGEGSSGGLMGTHLLCTHLHAREAEIRRTRDPTFRLRTTDVHCHSTSRDVYNSIFTSLDVGRSFLAVSGPSPTLLRGQRGAARQSLISAPETSS